MPDTNQLSALKKTAPTTPISMTSATPLKTVSTSKTSTEKNMDGGSDIELEIAKHQAKVKKEHFNLLLAVCRREAHIPHL